MYLLSFFIVFDKFCCMYIDMDFGLREVLSSLLELELKSDKGLFSSSLKKRKDVWTRETERAW